MMLRPSFIILLALLALVGCSKKSTTQATLSVSRSFAFGAGSGGLMIYMQNQTTQRLSSINLVSNEIILPLESGKYEFKAVGWDGSAPFEGNLLCGSTFADLTERDAIVDIVVSQAKCKSDVFAPANFRHATTGAILPLRLISCLGLGGVSAAGDLCDSAERGISGSYRFRLISYKDYMDGIFPDLKIGLSSKCIPAAIAPASLTAPSIVLPYGNPKDKYSVVIEAFTDGACAAGRQVYLFPKGLAYEAASVAKTLKFPTPANLDVYLQHGGLSITGNAAFGSVVIGDLTPPEQVFTIANFSPADISGMATVLPSGMFSFKGGSYPGAGGDCGSVLVKGASCTIVVTANAGASGPQNRMLNLTYNDGEVKTTGVLFSGLGQTPAAVSLSVSTYNFGTVYQGAPVSYAINVTNSGEADADGFTVSGISAPFVSTSTCTGPLAGGTSCTITVTFNVSSFGDFSATGKVDFDNGKGADFRTIGISGRGVMTGGVSPFYSSPASNAWNAYIYNDVKTSLFTDTNTPCAPLTHNDCQHVGELRKVELPSVFNSTTCANMTGFDTLGVFNWECDDSITPHIFRSTGFKKDKGLRDLLDASAWKPIFFQVNDIAGFPIFKSNPGAWWPNTVVSLSGYPINNLDVTKSIPISNGSGGTLTMTNITPKQNSGSTSGVLNTFELNGVGTIYVVSTNLTVPGINIAGAGAALVTINGAKLISNNASTINCGTNGTILGTGTAALVCVGANHAWVEANLEGSGSSGTVLQIGAQAKFGRVQGTNIKYGANGFEIYNTTKTNIIKDLTVLHSHGPGVQLSGADVQKFYNTKVFNAGTSGTGYGVRIYNGKNNVFHGLFISSSSGGVTITSNTPTDLNNSFTQVLAVSNVNHGLYMQYSNRNTITHSSFLNNTLGIKLFGSGSNYFNNIVQANSPAQTGVYLTSNSSANKFKNLVVAHNSDNIILDTGSINNYLYGLKTGAFGSEDCTNSNGPSPGFNYSEGTAMPNAFGVCPNSISSTLNSTFKGIVTSATGHPDNTAISGPTPGKVSVENITEYSFSNPFIHWGNVTADGTNYMHSSASGRFGLNSSPWDWRLSNNISPLLNSSPGYTAGSSCPTSITTSGTIQDLQTSPNDFYIYAIEITGDGIGDEDGLCESTESCLYAPNRGAYQGEGTIQAQCTFGDINLRAFTSFAAP